MSETIPHWLTKQADLAPNKLALEIDEEISLTFKELYNKSKQIAQKLNNLNINPKDRIAILSTNSLDMLMTIHALSYLDAIVVLLNTRLTSSELNYQIKNSEATLLITTEELCQEKKLETNKVKTFTEIKELKQNVDKPLNESVNLNDIWTIMYTSGTTGLPKAVGHTYGNHWWSAISSGLNLGIHADDKWLSPLPMYHVGGLSVFIKSIIYGMSVYLLPHYNKERLSNVLHEKEITIASLVTLMLADYLDSLEGQTSPAKLRAILLGGGSVPETLLNKAQDKKIRLFQSYGLTETSSQHATLSQTDNIRKLGSAGKTLMTGEVKVNAKTNEIGEVLVKGPMVISNYFNNEEATAESFKEGWLKTGDLGYLDEENFLYIVDRRSDLIISGGENIYPTEIENTLLNHDNIKEVAVVKKTDDKFGYVPAAFIVLKNKNYKPDFSSYLKDSLAKYKQPKEYIFIDELPRTASNKVKRFELEKRLQSSK